MIRARDAIKFSLIPRRERQIAMINCNDRGYFYVFTFQRLRAFLSDDTMSFSHISLLAFKISVEQAK